MFCGNCGTPLSESQAFCGNCGNRIPRAAAVPPVAPPPPLPPVPHAPPPLPPAASAQAPVALTRCEWCGADVQPGQPSCARCGAILKQVPVSTRSGWTQLPGRKDMAKLQIGRSSCQIEGLYVPVADMNLAAGDSVYFVHHVLLWKDPGVNITTMSLTGAWKRMLAGLPLIMTQAEGPGHIAFSKDSPGELIPLPLQPGQAIDVREHMLLAATANIRYDWFQTGIWFKTQNGDDTETHYPVGAFMDRFAPQETPGLLLLHASGNIFIRELAPGQSILIKPTALVFKDPTVSMNLHFETPQGQGFSFAFFSSWTMRYMWLRLYGPGRVAIQSVFEELNIGNMTSSSSQSW